jgi:hypothetical protein
MAEVPQPIEECLGEAKMTPACQSRTPMRGTREAPRPGERPGPQSAADKGTDLRRFIMRDPDLPARPYLLNGTEN